jgi:diguanylate cyclase (GGDEF)-like protein/PAS domain S-box-containing protein
MVNPSFQEMTGYTSEEAVGLDTLRLNGEIGSRNSQLMENALNETGHWEGELLGCRKNGQLYPRRLLVTAFRDKSGTIEQYVSIFTDLSQLKTAESQAEYFAHHDALTGLPNRSELEQTLPDALAQAAALDQVVTIALLNVDRFKSINETLGHRQGDELLVALSKRLRTLYSGERQLYRYGGDEFIVIIPGKAAMQDVLFNKLRTAVALPLILDGHPITPTASIGATIYPEQALDAPSLLRNVSAALGVAKLQGRNTWRLYDPEMNAQAFDDMVMAGQLRQAVESRELKLFLQPQFRINDGAIVGMEALLRWTHDTRGPVSPARFIPIAESSGLIVEISLWVLREACSLWAGWRDAGLNPPTIAINLSALQFQHADFLLEVKQAMQEFSIPANVLEMELTEGLIMANVDRATATMHQLVEMGVQLAIDDFGTGYSSLSYLQKFPVRKLKIDRSFVMGLGNADNRQGAAIATAVIGMGKNLNLKVIAEGVETLEQCNFLRDHGCDEVQGYLFAKPMSSADLAVLLTKLATRAPGVL